MKRWKQFLWSSSDKNRPLAVYEPILKRKAEEIAKKLSTEFRPSNGWIDRLKKRSGLVYKKVCGVANSVNPEEYVKTATNYTNSAYMCNKSTKNIKKCKFLVLPFYDISPLRSQIFLEFSKMS
jgi:hypothetical protein